MATKILLKKSSVAGAAPLTSDLEQGEIALNLADRKIYTKDNSNNIVTLDGAYVGATAPSAPSEGTLWYDTTNDLLKTHNGSAWAAAGYTSLGQFGITATAGELNTLDGITASTAELNHTDGVTSNIQTQLDGKQATITGAATTIDTENLTTNRAVVSNASGKIAVSAITSTELGYLDGVTSNVQTQLNSKIEDITGESIGDLSDVTVTAPGDNELLAYDSTAGKFINQTPTEAGFATVATTGDYSDLSGTPSVGNGTQTISAGVGLSGGGSFSANQSGNTSVTLNVDLDELSTSVTNGDGDYFVVVDTIGNQYKLTKANINLSGFNNDSGYITGYNETDTLSSVTARGASTTADVTVNSITTTNGDDVFGGNVTVTGNLTVNGTTTSVNSNEVSIGDSVIVLNSDEVAAPSQNAGFEVERGTSANVQFVWNETDDAWDMGNENLQNVTIDGGSY